MMEKQRQCAERFHPAEYLRDELKARGLETMEFVSQCGEIGLNSMHILQLLNDVAIDADDKRPVTRVLATGMVEVLGGDIETWLNLQKAYDEWEPGA